MAAFFAFGEGEEARGWERMLEDGRGMLEDGRGMGEDALFLPSPAVSKQEIRNFAGWAQTDRFFFPIWGRRAQDVASLTYY